MRVAARVVQERRGENARKKPWKWWIEKSNRRHVGMFENMFVYSLLKVLRLSPLG